MNNTPVISCDTLPKGTLSVEQAQARILAAVQPLSATEDVPLMHAAGRILAAPVKARIAVPAFTNSAMDGYALRHADVLHAEQPLRVVGTAFAGKPFSGNVGAGECIRIMTGALVPATLDTVVMQENVQRDGAYIRLNALPERGENLRYAGEDSQPGDDLLPQGRKLNAADIGLLASQGIASVNVIRKLRVAFCATGDELKALGEPLQPGDIYDSNRYTLNALLQKLDVEILDLGVVRDTREAVETAFRQAQASADVFITSG
ncbi:MAG: molybdopterin molybdotransferase MoeA, partial [Thiothrix sp.]